MLNLTITKRPMTSLPQNPNIDQATAAVCPVQLTYNHLLQQTANYPSSHAASHAVRVHNIALKLSASLDPPPNLLVVRLAALLHDIYDHKLTSLHNIPVESPSDQHPLIPFLRSIHIPESLVSKVVFIVENISFSKQNRSPLPAEQRTLELDVVQDADRLESMGAAGIARFFAFGGEISNTIEQSRHHFDEKIFRLRDLMRTPLAKRIAHQRHLLMKSFINAMDEEYQFAGQTLLSCESPVPHMPETKQ